MLSHALTIVLNELEAHLTNTYGTVGVVTPQVRLGNIAEGVGNTGPNVPRDVLDFSMVNIREEKTLKNIPKLHAKRHNPARRLPKSTGISEFPHPDRGDAQQLRKCAADDLARHQILPVQQCVRPELRSAGVVDHQCAR